MRTTATLHAHPACAIHRIFELRRLAREHGCQFITSRPRTPNSHGSTTPFGGAA